MQGYLSYVIMIASALIAYTSVYTFKHHERCESEMFTQPMTWVQVVVIVALIGAGMQEFWKPAY